MRLIDKNLLIAYLNAINPCKACSAYGEGAIDVIQHIFAYLDEMPEVEAEPVRHGRWLPVESAHDTRIAKCSICGFWQKSNGNDKTGNYNIHKLVYRYCAACGARMDGDAE